MNNRIPVCPPCNLKQGNTGDGVKVLQYVLACNGHYTLPDGRTVQRDGNFGPITREAVRLRQIDLGISAHGEYGPITADAVLTKGTCPVLNGEGWWLYACVQLTPTMDGRPGPRSGGAPGPGSSSMPAGNRGPVT